MSIKTSYTPNKKLKKQLIRYQDATNTALRKVGFIVYSISQSKYLRVVDGISVTRRAKKGKRGTRTNPTGRKTWPGLRRRTGNLARNIKVALEFSGVLKVLNSQFSASSHKKIASSVQVGVGGDVKYGVIHEREGRKQSGRKSGRNFYPFLSPALKDASKSISKIFKQHFREVERSKPS